MRVRDMALLNDDRSRLPERTGLFALTLGILLSLVLAVVPALAANGSGNDVPLPGAMTSPVPLEQAGTYIGFGRGVDDGQWDMPAELAEVALSKIATASEVTFALTADGRVVSWGVSQGLRINEIPVVVDSMEVVDLAASSAYAGVVAADGRVLVWGQPLPAGTSPLDVPPELIQPAALGQPQAIQLVLGQSNAYALMSDNTVRAWGHPGLPFSPGPEGLNEVPEGLRATQLAAAGNRVYALTTDGTVAAWGSQADETKTTLPEEVLQPGNVLAVTASDSGSLHGCALLADYSVTCWGRWGKLSTNDYPEWVQPDLDGKKAVAIASGENYVLVLDEDGTLHVGGLARKKDGVLQPLELEPLVELTEGHHISQFTLINGGNAAVLVTKMLRAEVPQITGTARAGTGSLTGTPGSFSGVPDQVSSQWVIDDTPVGDPVVGDSPSTLPLTDYAAGTKITYRSTATKAGEDTAVTESDAVTLSAAPKTTPSVVAKVNKAPTRKKPGKVTVRVQGGPTASGTVKVAMSGKVVKPKQKKKLQKLKTQRKKLKKQRKNAATPKKRKKIANKIKKVNQKVKKVKKKANKHKKITISKKLNTNGVAKLKLKKLARGKGKWTLRANYGGDTAHKAAKSKAVKFKVKKK